MRHFILTICAVLTLVACGNGGKKESKEAKPKSYKFVYVYPPMQSSDQDKFLFMREHFWDKFDFADSLYTTKADTMDIMKAYMAYVSNFVGAVDQEPIRDLMRKASVSKPMFQYFVSLSEKLFHDPNSPMRSDELYIAVLEAQLASPYLDKYEKMAPEYDLRIASQNRIGHKANNFDYTLRSGATRQMHNLKADFLIIYINNPGCPMCRDITEALKASELITSLIEQKVVKILAIYPDEQLNEWHKHMKDFPASWINSYDRGCHISRQQSYDLKAIPALYLLDREKNVLVKDSTNVGEIEYVISQILQQNQQ